MPFQVLGANQPNLGRHIALVYTVRIFSSYTPQNRRSGGFQPILHRSPLSAIGRISRVRTVGMLPVKGRAIVLQ